MHDFLNFLSFFLLTNIISSILGSIYEVMVEKKEATMKINPNNSDSLAVIWATIGTFFKLFLSIFWLLTNALLQF